MDVNVLIAILGCIGTWVCVIATIYYGNKKK